MGTYEMGDYLLMEGDHPSLVNFNNDRSVSISSNGTEVSTSSYNFSSVRGNVKVFQGRWYFEVRLRSNGSARIGWCSPNFTPESRYSGIGCDTESWGWDGSRNAKAHNESSAGTSDYGNYWSSGDIIGCLVDFEQRRIYYSQNGKNLGVAFTGVRAKDGLYPAISIHSGMRLEINFGKVFHHPTFGACGMNPILTAREEKSLLEIFTKYHDTGVNLADSGYTGDTIKGVGTLTFAEDIGASAEVDCFLLAMKLRSGYEWEFTKNEFVFGWGIEGCYTLEEMRNKVKIWKDEVAENPELFKNLYNFVFDYQLAENATTLDLESALYSWEQLDIPEKWGLYPKWKQFLTEGSKKGVTKDTWVMLMSFIDTIGVDVENYDDMDCWPSSIDDFVLDFLPENQ
eukprot:TRINITY_DN7489_c0_g1_i1.p1 TRINITY_DN7489_c0_g1~~TRINITY_DN7489_c0_g1_i1.p1  ORF type:complete len:416 (+),score=94.98 TRINITY_DN7489_c0_g1_i1:55-1248(+)